MFGRRGRRGFRILTQREVVEEAVEESDIETESEAPPNFHFNIIIMSKKDLTKVDWFSKAYRQSSTSSSFLSIYCFVEYQLQSLLAATFEINL